MGEVVVVGLGRSAQGNFQGALASVSAPRLGGRVIEGVLKKYEVRADEVSEVILGNVLTAGEGQAPARQASLFSGISKAVPTMTVNKVCGSGMKAVMLGVQSILLGDSQVVVAGGMENMSQVPFLLQQARGGLKMGHQTLIDSMIHDGLWDPYQQKHMGNCAELCAREKGFSRQEQDEYAVQSFRRAQEAQKNGKFQLEIIPLQISGKKGEVEKFEFDEGPSKVQFEKIPLLKPVFDSKGSVTAANASTINDGAAVLVLASPQHAKKLGLKPQAKVVSYATHAHEPEWFTTAPIDAMRKAVKKAQWDFNSIDLFEVNEAFAVVALAAQKELKIPADRLNVWGGAISLGHPIGASGARIIVTLISALKNLGLKRGIAGICIGGGEATAICIEVC